MIYLVSERFEGIYDEIFPIITTFVYKLGIKSGYLTGRILSRLDLLGEKYG